MSTPRTSIRFALTRFAVLGVAPLAACLALSPACSKDKKNDTAAGGGAVSLGPAKSMGGISAKVPQGWTEVPVTSNMRRAHWKIAGDAGEAELIVYYFGEAGAGSVQANLDRWYGQFQQPDGSPSKDAAQTATSTVAGMEVTTVDVSGRYVAQVRPGAEERHDVPDSRMLAAIVQASDGAYYFKLVGPAATVAAAKAAFDAMIGSLQKAG